MHLLELKFPTTRVLGFHLWMVDHDASGLRVSTPAQQRLLCHGLMSSWPWILLVSVSRVDMASCPVRMVHFSLCIYPLTHGYTSKLANCADHIPKVEKVNSSIATGNWILFFFLLIFLPCLFFSESLSLQFSVFLFLRILEDLVPTSNL